jgi:hypothetical protein
MKTIVRLEEVAQFGLSILFFNQIDYAWWWFPALILLPDIGMIGYAVNTRVGGLTYNLLHHKGIAIIVGIIGYLTGNQVLMLSGIILFGHASMDRIFGYGLKYNDSFHHTHLGWLKQKEF